MTQVLTPSDETVRDFTRVVDVRFRIDDDIFVGKRGIAAFKLMTFGALFDGLSATDVMSNPDAFIKMFMLILEPKSAARFIERLDSDEEPITLEQVMDVLPHLMEQYGLRPLEPSPSSSDGLVNLGAGTSSTESALPTALVLPNFPPTSS